MNMNILKTLLFTGAIVTSIFAQPASIEQLRYIGNGGTRCRDG